VRWDTILFEARFTLARPAVKFPVVPGARDVIAVERSFAERTPDVVAYTGNRTEFAILADKSDFLAPQQDLLNRLETQLVRGTNIDPRFRFHAQPSRY
jgi:hypothetical protein